MVPGAVRNLMRDFRAVPAPPRATYVGVVRDKRATAERVLAFRVRVVDSHGPDSTFASRAAAEDEAGRLRASGLRTVVQPVHTPLPTNPWLCIDR